MRRWKRGKGAEERVFLYFRDHANKFFTPEHVAAQVGVGRRRGREIVASLERIGKLEGVDTISTKMWGRPRRMYRAIRTTEDSLRQLEAFTTALKSSGLAVGP